MKKLINDRRWGPIITLLSNIAIIEWLVFPGLTLANTFINMLALFSFIALFLYDVNYVKERYFTISEEEKALEAKWKADLEEKMKQVKRKSKTK